MLNYMALGLPVVAFDTPVHREYLGEHGTWVEPHSVEGLADAIADLAHHPQKRKKLGELLRQRVTKLFTWPAAAKKIESVYKLLFD